MPNFIVVGAEKSGTSSIYNLLKSHPDIYMPDSKELSFFNDKDSNGSLIEFYSKNGIEWYKSFFTNNKSQKSIWRGEASPLYMESKISMDRIHKYCGDIKIICILRDPIDRYLSCIQMAKRNGDIKIDQSNIFSNNLSILYLERGLYGKQIINIKSKFSELLVLDFLDLKNDYILKKKLGDFFNLESSKFGEVPHSNPKISLRSSSLYRLKRYLARKLRNSKNGNKFLNLNLSKKISRYFDYLNSYHSENKSNFIINEENIYKLKKYYYADVKILEKENYNLSFIKNYNDF